MTVDSHVHLLPDRLAAAIRAWFADRLGYTAWVYPTDHGEVCERLAGEGVEEAWTLPYAHKPGMADDLNTATAAIAAGRSGGPVRILAGATTHPAEPEPAAPVRRAVERHGAGVLKLHCSVGDFPPDDPRLDPVWDYVSAVRLPVVVHAGHAPTGRTDGHDLSPLGLVADRFADARLIIAHCGHPATTEALALAARHRNVYVDLTPVVAETAAVTAADLEPVGHKVLFGSDAPNTFVPAGAGLVWLDGLGLSPATLAAIRGGTARRLQAEMAR